MRSVRATTVALIALAFVLVGTTTPARASRPAVSASAGVLPAVSSLAALPGPSPWKLSPLHARRGSDAGVFDSAGRQVLLRGVNVNGVGDYYQPNPAYPSTIPLTAADFEEMASFGFNTIRLIVSWSALEPTKGQLDAAYLARVHEAVDRAKANGIYVILDMHQDAWAKFIASPPGVVCPPGYEPSVGWDGAPAWATITDGLDTCHQTIRENAPAVIRAFDNFYADRDGIRGALVRTWGALAAEFADEPAVAGYDLLNEPNVGSDLGGNASRLGEFTQAAIAAIRAGEASVPGGFPHIAFFEPIVLWPLPGTAVPVEHITDPNVVFAPHNYFESLNSILTLEQGFELAAATAATYGTTFWFGEYGWFSDPAVNAEKLARFARQEDAHLVSGAWWQWKQACGDPHSIGTPNGTPAPTLLHFHASTCPGDGNQTPVPEWVTVLSRPYPRSAPGRLQALASDGAAGAITLVAAQDTGAQPASQPLEVWVPERGAGPPEVRGINLFDIEVVPIDGGFRVTASTCGTYSLAIGAPLVPVESGCGGASSPTSAPVVTSVLPLQTPRFTG